MKVELTSTEKLVEVNGVPARIWEGTSEGGVKIHAYITRIAADPTADLGQFDRELQSHVPPSPEVAAIPTRLIL